MATPGPQVQDVSDVQEALADLATRRATFTRELDEVQRDAGAASTRRRGRPLPAPTAGGDQLPAVGVQITEVVNRREGEERVRVIPPEEIPWQNLANHLEAVRRRGLDKLDRQERQLREIIVARRQPQAGPQPQAPRQAPGKDPQKVYPWVDYIADIIGYVVVFWGLVAAAQAVGIFTLFAGLALLALTGLLRGVIIDPIRGAIKIVFHAVLQVLLDLIEFVGTWFQGIINYFQGDFIRAVLQMLEVAAFMWIWAFAMRIPVIGQLIQFITDAVGQAVQFINNVFDQVTGFVNRLRKDTEAGLAQVFQTMGEFGKFLLQSVDAQLDRLAAGLTSRLNTLRFELVREIDLVSAFTRSTITVFGIKLQLVPEEVRVYLLRRNLTRPFEALQNTTDLLARAGSGLATPAVAIYPPWAAAAELERIFRGIAAGQAHDLERHAQATEAWARSVATGAAPDVPDLPPEFFRGAPPSPGDLPPPPPPGRPAWVPAVDWPVVQGICGADHVAYLAAAIGQHETGWGTLGAGRDGFILGVGVFGGVQQAQFRGLVNQLDWACSRLRAAFPGPETVTRDAVIAFGRDVYRVPDPGSWGNDVYDLYAAAYIPPGGIIA